ncbi:MAG: YIP1 family protein [Planctomycetes bacterium]|nr:YIP1 family protein [Planctomycetota bacterium]
MNVAAAERHGPPPCAAHPRATATTTCAGCGLFLCAACAEPEARCLRCRGGGHPVAWEDPTLSTPVALGRTLKALSGAGKFFDQLPWSGGLRAPLTFAALVATLAAAGAALFTAVGTLAGGGALGTLEASLAPLATDADARQGLDLVMQFLRNWQALQLRFALLQVAWAPLLAPLQLVILGALTHGLARLLGGRGSFEATVRAMGYAHGGQILQLVPMAGSTLAALLVLVLTGVGLRRAHGVSPGRAVVLTLWPIPVALLFGCLLLGLVVSRVMPILLR